MVSLEQKLFRHHAGLPVISGNEENVVVLLAGLVDLTNGLVGGSNTLDGSLVHTSVADHIRWGEVVHDEIKLALTNALRHLGTDSGCAHLGVKVVGGHSRRGDHVANLTGELLLNTTVEEESNVRILLSLGNVALREVLLAQPLGQNIAHVLRGEGNGECVVGLVLGHGGEGNVLGVGDVGTRGAVVVTQQLGNLTDTIRAVVEEEDGVII